MTNPLPPTDSPAGIADGEIEELERLLSELIDEEWSSSDQDGPPGHCCLAQVFDGTGMALAFLDAHETPRIASTRASLIVAMRNAIKPLIQRLKRAEAERDAWRTQCVDAADSLNSAANAMLEKNGKIKQLESERDRLWKQHMTLISHDNAERRVLQLESERDRLKEALDETRATLDNIWVEAEPEMRAYYTEVPDVLKIAAAALADKEPNND